MYTYQFNYSSSVDGFGTIQFCSYTKKEATDLFESWQAENGYNIPEYTVQTVYNRADAELEKHQIYVIQIEYIIKSLLYIKVLRKTNKNHPFKIDNVNIANPKV